LHFGLYLRPLVETKAIWSLIESGLDLVSIWDQTIQSQFETNMTGLHWRPKHFGLWQRPKYLVSTRDRTYLRSLTETGLLENKGSHFLRPKGNFGLKQRPRLNFGLWWPSLPSAAPALAHTGLHFNRSLGTAALGCRREIGRCGYRGGSGASVDR